MHRHTRRPQNDATMTVSSLSALLMLTSGVSVQSPPSVTTWCVAVAVGLIAVYYVGLWLTLIVRPSTIADQVVMTILIAGSAFGVIHVYRLLIYQLPSTPWEEAIFLSANRFR